MQRDVTELTLSRKKKLTNQSSDCFIFHSACSGTSMPPFFYQIAFSYGSKIAEYSIENL
jgi:hypothetical protein